MIYLDKILEKITALNLRDIMDMSSLFNENDDTDSMSTSDLLVSHLDSDEDKLVASDLTASNGTFGVIVM
jgi:hypothetical protein